MNQMTRRGVVIAVAATAFAPAAFAQQRDGGEYRILQARYGTAQRNVDVTQRLQELARNDQSFPIANDTFGVDPDQGRTKSLRLFARAPNGQIEVFEYREGDLLDGLRFAGWSGGRWGDSNYRGGWGDGPRAESGDNGQYRIQQASYGTSRRSIDVTERLRELTRNDQKFAIGNDTFGSDPDTGRAKTLRVTALGPYSQTQVFEYREGDVLDASLFNGLSGGRGGDANYRGGPAESARGDEAQYRIQQALYGTARRNVDVTERLRELARSEPRFAIGNDTFGSDPDEGRTKTLRIFARAPDGTSKTFEYREGSVIDGSQFVGWVRGDWGQDGRRGGWAR